MSVFLFSFLFSFIIVYLYVGKLTELLFESDSNNDSSVNIAYLDSKTGDWVSISGKAVINTDRSKVKKHFSAGLKAWFDDKKDGTHTGDENDPRVALIDVHPDVSVLKIWKKL